MGKLNEILVNFYEQNKNSLESSLSVAPKCIWVFSLFALLNIFSQNVSFLCSFALIMVKSNESTWKLFSSVKSNCHFFICNAKMSEKGENEKQNMTQANVKQIQPPKHTNKTTCIGCQWYPCFSCHSH